MSMRTMHGTRKTTPTSVRSPLNPHGPRCSIARLCAEKANPQISAHTMRARNPQRRIVIRGKDMAGIIEAFLRPSNAFGAAGGRVKPIHVPCMTRQPRTANRHCDLQRGKGRLHQLALYHHGPNHRGIHRTPRRAAGLDCRILRTPRNGAPVQPLSRFGIHSGRLLASRLFNWIRNPNPPRRAICQRHRPGKALMRAVHGGGGSLAGVRAVES